MSQENVPAELPGIAFLSGGQTEIESTEHLDMMNKIGGFPWKLSFHMEEHFKHQRFQRG